MNTPLWFDDLKIGDSWKSRGRTVTEADIVNFACMTGDFDPLHVDHEFAKKTPFGKPIAHGLLGLAWVAGLGFNNPAVQTLAFLGINRWEFVKPILVGDTLTVHNEIVELRLAKNRRRGHVIWKRSLLNQTGVVVQLGLLETLVACREPANAPASEPSNDQSSLPSPAIAAAADSPVSASATKKRQKPANQHKTAKIKVARARRGSKPKSVKRK